VIFALLLAHCCIQRSALGTEHSSRIKTKFWHTHYATGDARRPCFIIDL